MNTRTTREQHGTAEETPTSLLTPSERYVFEHQTCAMCESELEITHNINKLELKVKEEAYCPSCGIRVRSSHHLMQ